MKDCYKDCPDGFCSCPPPPILKNHNPHASGNYRLVTLVFLEQQVERIKKLEDEVNRQRALIERGKPLIKEALQSLKYPRGVHAIEYWENQYSNWLKDASGEVKG